MGVACLFMQKVFWPRYFQEN